MNDHVPEFLFGFLDITQEGLFRKSGSLSRQQELKVLLNSGADLNLDYGTYSAHDCASVLKSFLADLPEPLLTEGHYSIHCKIAGKDTCFDILLTDEGNYIMVLDSSVSVVSF